MIPERIESFLSLAAAIMTSILSFLLGRGTQKIAARNQQAEGLHLSAGARKIEVEALIAAMEAIRKTYKATIDDLDNRIGKMEKTLETLRTENALLRVRVDELEGHLRQKDAQISEMERHIDTLTSGGKE